MTRREHFFSVLEGDKPERMPFFPDITDWYVANRTPQGEPRAFGAAQFIPDDAPIHRNPGTIPERYRDFTFLDFYREFDWGLPVHIGNWFETQYAGGVERIVKVGEGRRTTRLVTPKGELTRVDLLASDGSWAPHEHFIKSLNDLDAMQLAVEATRFVPRYEQSQAILDAIGGRGMGDAVVMRSPFGKMVHEYMGFDKVVYAMADSPGVMADFLALQERKDLELVELAAGAPNRVVILSDHADENLISPRQYEEHCIPYYQKMNAILHAAGKFVSTHLDGNFKGFFPVLGDTGFDLLDGCTPAPMFNYEVEELAAAMPERMCAWCGVPATLLCQHLPTDEIIAFGRRIADVLQGRAILNIGDILPPDADIQQVIALGESMK